MNYLITEIVTWIRLPPQSARTATDRYREGPRGRGQVRPAFDKEFGVPFTAHHIRVARYLLPGSGFQTELHKRPVFQPIPHDSGDLLHLTSVLLYIDFSASESSQSGAF